MFSQKLYITFILAFSLSTAVHSKDAPPTIDWKDSFFNISFDATQPINFIGKKALDKSNNIAAGGMMYPADTAGIFLVSILTHAAINGGVQSKRLTKEQEAANQVLNAYKTAIDQITPEYLWDNDIIESTLKNKAKFLQKNEHSDDSKWEIKVMPVFALTQNQGSLMIYNNLLFSDRSLIPMKKSRNVKKSTKRTKKNYIDPNIKKIVIVSDPAPETDAEKFWADNNEKVFLETAKKIYLESFILAIQVHGGALAEAQAEQSTIRYLEDNTKKIERGYVIEQTCERTLFRSLLVEIKSVPNLGFHECKNATGTNTGSTLEDTASI